jgi:thermitase
MNSQRLFTTAVAVALVGGAFAGSAPYVPGQILVKFKPEAAASRGLAHAAIAAQVTSEIQQIGVQTVKLPKGMSVESAIKYYRGLSNVAYAEPNYILKADFTPNDPRYNEQYMHRVIGTPAAWDLTLGSPTVKIAIIDTGVDYNHEDLSGKVIKGKDFVNNDSDPMDDHGHGTHCAGIAAGKTNNGIGIAGTGFNCGIIAEKVLGANGSGQLDWAAAAMIDATDRGADVLSMSLGGDNNSQAQEDAAAYCWKKGAVLVAAAGNSNLSSKHYPAAIESFIAVGASDQNDKKADFSNYGADWVDVAAPGVAIMSTLPGNKYEAWDGTSMACPVVSGLVGLMKSYGPQTTNVQLRQILESNCVNIGTWIAKGRIDAFKSVSAIIKPLDKEFGVKTVGIYANQGTRLTGNAGALEKADAQKVTLLSVNQPNVGTVAAISSSLSVNQDLTKVRSASMFIQGQALKGVTLQLYLYNFSTGKYEIVKAVSATGANQTVEVSLPKLSPYVSGTTMNAIVRGFNGTVAGRAPASYTLSLDVMKLRALVNP